jgi:hypothetical protein
VSTGWNVAWVLVRGTLDHLLPLVALSYFSMACERAVSRRGQWWTFGLVVAVILVTACFWGAESYVADHCRLRR